MASHERKGSNLKQVNRRLCRSEVLLVVCRDENHIIPTRGWQKSTATQLAWFCRKPHRHTFDDARVRHCAVAFRVAAVTRILLVVSYVT